MRLYNTLTRKKEIFIPLKEKKIKMYVCGPTTYNYIHIGNSRPMIIFDSMRKYFMHLGYDVTYIQNYTDIDDKIINKSFEKKIPVLKLANKYIKEFEKDSDFLNILPATYSPRVSENIKEIIEFIKSLINKGIAYEIEGNVYFEVRKFINYGKLSKRNIDKLKSGIRINVESKKKDLLDFILWKKVKSNEISWESPWGKGRPGWHIECSAMSMKYTNKETLDIHGGGLDLIFPHHENEIAQSESFLKKPFVNYWLHNGIVTINKEKMSKSLKNNFLIRDILKKYSGEIIRYFILSNHYRNPIEFNYKILNKIEKSLIRLNNIYKNLDIFIKNKIDSKSTKLEIFVKKIKNKIEKALQDDFNTALAISYFFELEKEILKSLKKEEANIKSLKKAYYLFEKYLKKIFSILPYKKIKLNTNDISSKLIDILIKLRLKEKNKKNFELADYIRENLKLLGINLIDTEDGTKWEQIILNKD